LIFTFKGIEIIREKNMAIVPKKLSFQLRFRNKTKTRKIFSRSFQLQGLLKKHLNNSSSFYYSFIKKEEQKHLLRSPQISRSLININQETKVVKSARFFNKSLKDNLLHLGLAKMYHGETSLTIKEKAKSLLFTWVMRKITEHPYLQTRKKKNQSNLITPNQHAYTYKKKRFCKPSWFLTLNKIEDSYLQFAENPEDSNALKLQKLFSTDLQSNKNKSLNLGLKCNSIFLKKTGVALSRPKAKKLLFGRYGICFKQYSIISSKCVETAKLDIAKNLRKKGHFWIRICCDTPVSARPAETRMGKGKGSVSYWAAKVTPGQLFFEFSGVNLVQLKEIYQNLCEKSAIRLKMVY
jgi:large subunit ribosomal protein L16